MVRSVFLRSPNVTFAGKRMIALFDPNLEFFACLKRTFSPCQPAKSQTMSIHSRWVILCQSPCTRASLLTARSEQSWKELTASTYKLTMGRMRPR